MSNAIFAKGGKFTSEIVVHHLLRTACLPVLMYALEVMPVSFAMVNNDWNVRQNYSIAPE